ncbi:hypothetical protein K469DRAFT_381328 [Zopfia rhizophila CBS 207.26]|uniref:Uncharacterized protein n=1 Tax=Zopfia rhizophila CBS 207.26 TaxID=1314779 RepID=A0A6A6DDM2_9PEZI|nr:hypothetical protein K469DRAFT_381328 [Zopfia rhizophila CBS 207.26]
MDLSGESSASQAGVKQESCGRTGDCCLAILWNIAGRFAKVRSGWLRISVQASGRRYSYQPSGQCRVTSSGTVSVPSTSIHRSQSCNSPRVPSCPASPDSQHPLDASTAECAILSRVRSMLQSELFPSSPHKSRPQTFTILAVKIPLMTIASRSKGGYSAAMAYGAISGIGKGPLILMDKDWGKVSAKVY